MGMLGAPIFTLMGNDHRMTFHAFGLNHETAPVAVREAFALDEAAQHRLYRLFQLSAVRRGHPPLDLQPDRGLPLRPRHGCRFGAGHAERIRRHALAGRARFRSRRRGGRAARPPGYGRPPLAGARRRADPLADEGRVPSRRRRGADRVRAAPADAHGVSDGQACPHRDGALGRGRLDLRPGRTRGPAPFRAAGRPPRRSPRAPARDRRDGPRRAQDAR